MIVLTYLCGHPRSEEASPPIRAWLESDMACTVCAEDKHIGEGKKTQDTDGIGSICDHVTSESVSYAK